MDAFLHMAGNTVVMAVGAALHWALMLAVRILLARSGE